MPRGRWARWSGLRRERMSSPHRALPGAMLATLAARRRKARVQPAGGAARVRVHPGDGRCQRSLPDLARDGGRRLGQLAVGHGRLRATAPRLQCDARRRSVPRRVDQRPALHPGRDRPVHRDLHAAECRARRGEAGGEGTAMYRVDEAHCTGCGECVEACAVGAIAMVDGRPAIDPAIWAECGSCAEACPQGAIVMASSAASPFRSPSERTSVVANRRRPGAPVRLIDRPSVQALTAAPRRSQRVADGWRRPDMGGTRAVAGDSCRIAGIPCRGSAVVQP